MKKISSVLAITLLVLLSGCKVSMGDGVLEEKQFDISDLDSTKISIVMHIGDLTIKESPDEKVHVSYYTYDSVKYKIIESDNELKLEQVIEKNTDNSWKIEGVTILIPKQFSGAITTESATGSLNVSNISARSIDLEKNTGNINLSNISANSIYLKSNTSDLSVSDISANNIDLKNNTGNINISNISANQSINLSNNTGNINGSIKGHKNDFTIESSVSIGENNIPSGGTGGKTLNVKNNIGDIEITFTP